MLALLTENINIFDESPAFKIVFETAKNICFLQTEEITLFFCEGNG